MERQFHGAFIFVTVVLSIFSLLSLVRRTSPVSRSHATLHQSRIRRRLDWERPSVFESGQILSRSAEWVSASRVRSLITLWDRSLPIIALLPQANTHLIHARQILEQFQPLEEHLTYNFLAFNIYLHSIKCALQAKQHLSQRDSKLKNKHVQAIDTTHVVRDLELMDEHLAKIQHLTSSKDYDQKRMEYLAIQFDLVTNNLQEFDANIHKLSEEIIEHIEKYPADDLNERKINLYLRLGFYLINDERSTPKAFETYQKAVQLAEVEQTSDLQRHQLANVLFQWGKARVRAERLTGMNSHWSSTEIELLLTLLDKTERKFQRAIELYRATDGELDLDGLKVIDELATFYTKLDKYQVRWSVVEVLLSPLDNRRSRKPWMCSATVFQTSSASLATFLKKWSKHDHALALSTFENVNISMLPNI